MKVILLNGPPESGKDTIAHVLETLIGESAVLKFAQPIIDHMQSTYGVSCVDGEDKNQPCEALGGKSRRQYAIDWSEDWIKPRFGVDWFGRQALAAATSSRAEVVVFSDSGFIDESIPVVKALGLHNCIQVRLTRPGCDFSNDSRSHWHITNLPFYNFHNDGPKDGLHARAIGQLLPHFRRCLKM
jgi:hypothetical protein